MSLDYDAFLKGVKEFLEKKCLSIFLDGASPIIQTAISEAMQKRAELSAVEERNFLEKNGKRQGVITTDSWRQYEVISEGTGPPPQRHTAKVDYVGIIVDGVTFDIAITRGEPAVFPLDRSYPVGPKASSS